MKAWNRPLAERKCIGKSNWGSFTGLSSDGARRGWGKSTEEYFGNEVMRSRKGEAKRAEHACLNAISLRIGENWKNLTRTPKGRVLVREVQRENLKDWQKQQDLGYCRVTRTRGFMTKLVKFNTRSKKEIFGLLTKKIVGSHSQRIERYFKLTISYFKWKDVISTSRSHANLYAVSNTDAIRYERMMKGENKSKKSPLPSLKAADGDNAKKVTRNEN